MKQICKNCRTQTQLHTRNFSQLSAIKKISCFFSAAFGPIASFNIIMMMIIITILSTLPIQRIFSSLHLYVYVCWCWYVWSEQIDEKVCEREPSSENSLCLSVCFMWICFSILTSWPIRSQCARRNKWMKWEKEKRRRKNAAELNDIHQKPFQIFN